MSPDEAKSEFNSNIPSFGGMLNAMEVIESRVLTLVSAMTVYATHFGIPFTPARSVQLSPPGSGPSPSQEHAELDLPVHDDPADRVSDPADMPATADLEETLRRKALKALQLATARKPGPRRRRTRGRPSVKSRRKKRR